VIEETCEFITQSTLRSKETMMNSPKLRPVSEAEMIAVQGGGIFSWLGKVVGAVESVLRSINRPWT
jgi:hypothetical protein